MLEAGRNTIRIRIDVNRIEPLALLIPTGATSIGTSDVMFDKVYAQNFYGS